MNLFTYGDSWTAGDGISKHLNQKNITGQADWESC